MSARHILQAGNTLDQEGGRSLHDAFSALHLKRGDEVFIDLAAAETMDSLGGAWLSRIVQEAARRHASVAFGNAQSQVAEFLEVISPALRAAPEKPRTEPGLLESIGDATIRFISESREFLNLCVDALYWTVIAPFEGRGFRFNEFLDEVYEMGVRAVRIVCLMNFLVGLIIAMLSAKQVESFGLQIYVANLIMIAFARELAAVMTAVVVSARTGAAIAAEIATMEVQEEIDALRGMGINTAQYLVAPKLLGLVVALPCLTVLGMVFGVLGGALWGIVVLGFRPSIWYQQTLGAADMNDIIQGMLKSFFFAIAIALIGCHNGFRVTGGSRGVGRMTTRAVVMDVFSLVLIDMVFATFFYYIFKQGVPGQP
ncbi:MAG TPA: ABC transporter permease [Candidatus Hydrogenedentes bacterium]|nr:ABC transporter permease [Candidatus Hydrogenedentota bacterium]